jgi:endo-1,4-beta-D-glucanase Y
MINIIKTFLRGFVMVLVLSAGMVNAQINTPAGATNPFGSNLSYGNGIMPTNLPTGGAFGKSQDAADAYNEWKAFYVDQSCAGGTQARVKFDDVNKTVSEGIAYGMLLSAYAADQSLFNKLWAYYKGNANGNNIMNWEINGCSGVIGSNGATDAELDAAMALIIASKQWPATASYSTDASNLITKIKNTEIDGSSFQAINGDGWGFGNTCRNLSYQAPAYYKAFATQNPSESTFWTNAITGSLNLITANAHPTTGLVSDWSDNNGNRNTCNGGYNGYGYDACRNPWRMAVDVIWWNTNTGSQNICSKIATYINGQGVGNIKGPRNQDGTGGGNHNAVFVGMYAAAVVGTSATNQTLMNSLYTEAKNTKDALQTSYPSGYFGNTLRCMSLFVMTGNFWKPGTQASQKINVNVAGVDVPNASTFDFQNVQNALTKSITFTIQNKGSIGLNLTGTPIVNVTSGAANYTVTTQPGATSLAGGATTTFIVKFTPGSNGVKTGTLSIANNDATQNPYIINLTGTGTPGATNPNMFVSQNAVNINSGGTYNLGNVTYNSTSATNTYVTFTINNTGDAPLNLTASTVTGTGYTLDLAPTTPVAIAGSTTFRIKFTPASTGTKTGNISIPSNDPFKNPFVVNFTANAVVCSADITSSQMIMDYEANNNLTPNYVNAAFTTVVNPFPTGNDLSYVVEKYIHPASSSYDGIQYKVGCGGGTLPTTNILISMLIYSPQVGVPVVMNLKDPSGLVGPGYPSITSVTVNTTKANQWERLYFKHGGALGNANVQYLEIFIDPASAKGAAGAATYYIDEIKYDTDPCLTDLPASGIINDYDNHRNLNLAYLPVGTFNDIFTNPFPTGINTSATVAKYGHAAASSYDGIRYVACGSNLDFSSKTVISLQVYSPIAGVPVILSMKNAAGTGVLDVTSKTTLVNTWETLYFDFTSIKNNTTVTKFDIMIDPLSVSGAQTYYIDNIQYDINPCYTGIAASGVMQDYNANRFLNMTNTNAAFNDIVANPSATGINTSTTVARLVRPSTGTYNLIRYQPCGANFDLSPGKSIYAMDVYSPVAGMKVYMMLKKYDALTTLVVDSATVATANTWTTLTFDFSSKLASDSGSFLDIYLDPNIVKGAQTYYIDNIRFAPAAPEINVRQNTTDIPTAGSFAMGTVNVGSSSTTIAFTIQNNGTGDLLLSGAPKIAIAGANPGDFVIDQTTTIGTVSAVSSTTFTVTFTPTAGGARSATLSIANNDSNENPYIINLTGTATCTLPSAAGAITGPSSVCSGATGQIYSLTAVAGATGYTWTVPTGASITAGAGTNSITVTFGATAGNVTVTPTNVCGNGTAASSAVAINTVPSAAGTITGSAAVCSGAVGQIYSITAVAGATGYTWTVPAGASITAGAGTTSITVTFGSTAGNVTVTPTNTCGSGTAGSQAITINTVPSAAGSITGSSGFCSGATGQIYSLTAVAGATGYTWTVPTGASITAGAGTTSITVTFGSTAGNITVTPTNTCGSGTATSLPVTINPLPSAAGTITGPASACSGATGKIYSITAVANATGYTWTVPAGASITAGAGTTSITVTFGSTAGNVAVTPTNTCGSGTASTTPITINTVPPVPGTITGSTTVCSGATGITYSIASVAGATGYTWTVPAGASITAGAGTTGITVTFGSTAGNVTVTPTNTCGNGTANSTAVAISTVPGTAGAITGSTTVCSGAAGVTYSIAAVAGATGYTWTVPAGSTITAGAGTTGITVTFGSTAGNVSVLPTNSCGNGTSNSVAITISGAANPAGAITGLATVCSGASGVTYSITAVAGATGYTWTVPAGSTITAGAGTTGITVTFGSTAGNVTVTPTSTCGSGASSSQAVAVNPPASAAGSITGPATVCSGATGQIYSIASVAGATGYTWTVPAGATITAGGTTNSITVTLGSTAGNVTVTPTSTCGNGTASSTAVAISTVPSAAGAITGPTTVCSGQVGVTYSITSVAGATGYNWTVPAGSTITAGTGTNAITVTFGSTAGNVSVTPTNTCGNGTSNSTAITISGAANPAGAITGLATVCSGAAGVTYSITAVAGATGYTWTVPAGSAITAGAGTTGITVTFGSTAGNVTVTPTSTCGSGASSSQAITVNPPASAAGSITGSTTVCSGTAGVTYSIASVAGATGYTWTVPAGSTITAGAGTNAITVTFGSTAGNVTVTPTSTCGNGTASSIAVAISTVPSAAGAITGSTTVCSGQAAVTYSISSVAGATSYNWTVPAGSTITAGTGTNSITVTFGSTAGNVGVTPTNTCGNGTSNSVAITISGAANPAGAITGLATVCSGASGVIYSITSVAGATGYNWTVPAGSTITAGTNTTSITVTFGSSAGNVSVSPTSTCGSGASSSQAIVVNPPASAAGSITGLGTLCSGATGVTYSIASVSGATGYNWTVPAGATITAGTGTTGITVTFGSTAGNVTVTPTSTCGNGTAASLAVTISTVPGAAGTITGPSSLCNAAAGQVYSIASVVGATGYSWTVPAGSTITAGTGTNSITITFGGVAGNVIATPTNACGSGTSSNMAVSLFTGSCTAPTTQSISGPTTVTAGQTVTYSVTPPVSGSTYNWTLPPGSSIVSATPDSSSVTVLIGPNSGTVGLKETNAAGSTTSSLPITVNTATGTTSGLGIDTYEAYPTPFEESAIVKINSVAEVPLRIKIMDSKGVVVYTTNDYYTNQEVLLGKGLAIGIYYVEVSYQDKVQVIKLVKI